MRTVLLILAWTLAMQAADGNPIVRFWQVNPAAQSTTNPALRAILPNVQAVRTDERYVYVESAGLSLQSLGAIEGNDRQPPAGPRKFVFRFPLVPRASTGGSTKTPVGFVGAFLTGVPLYNPVSEASYQDQNLWHFDAVGALSRQAGSNSSAMAALLKSNGQHSPLIGFALDGFPIYGPYGLDEDSQLRRFRSSYRIRKMGGRATLPDGTELTPSQEGPRIADDFPLGTFAEDYEYISGSGDLDEHHGRWARTPEFPQGTYAYFLTTAYPYLVGSSYFGRVELTQIPSAMSHHAPLDASHARQIDLMTPATLHSDKPESLTLLIRDARGRAVRFLEKVHERPIHLLVVSTDLSDFAHIHPELQPDDTYTVSYSFPHGGTYFLFADYTRPGMPQSISRFRLTVSGAARPAEALRPDDNLSKTQDGLEVKLRLPAKLQVGQDLPFRFDVPVNDLEPYLGAWAHIMIVSQDREEFIHAHPSDEVAGHTHAAPGPSPSTISTVTGFRKPGLYRVWAQFQRQGRVITVPFTIRVEPAEGKPHVSTLAPANAIPIRVSATGFEPSRITLAAGKNREARVPTARRAELCEFHRLS